MKLSFTSLVSTSVSFFLVWTHSSLSDAQTPQRVQLPAFHSFRAGTTVSVPYRGSVFAGGVNGASRARGTFGGPLGGHFPGLSRGLRNRGFAGSRSAGSITMSATIIDHSALDRAVLAEAARRRGACFDVLGRPVEPPLASDHAMEKGDRSNSRHTRRLLRLAHQAEADGDLRSAQVFYDLATERE